MFIINGLTPASILSVLLACATQGDHATKVEASAPSDVRSQVESGEDQHFCCDDVDPSTWSAEGCLLVSEDNLNTCDTIFYCDGKWERQDGHVDCDSTPNDKADAPREFEDQHFCCSKLDNANKSGEGCSMVPKELLGACGKILYCSGDWSLDEGKAQCL